MTKNDKQFSRPAICSAFRNFTQNLRESDSGPKITPIKPRNAIAEVELLTGLEPVTSPLPRECSTTELQERYHFRSLILSTQFKVERETGLEPATLSLEG
jgi:hypothetical protein